MSGETAKITLEGKEFELPVITGTENEKAIDISKLRAMTGYVTLDIGYKNTGSTQSAITFLNGEQGILHYRGYTIEELADKASFTEVAYLLLEGKLPNAEELNAFHATLSEHAQVAPELSVLFDAIPSNAHPMGQLVSLLSCLSAYYPESLDYNRSDERKRLTTLRLLAKLPILCAMIHRKRKGLPFVAPDPALDYVSNYLRMTFADAEGNYEIDPIVVDAMNKLFILHADHEQNCSASTVRLVGSSQANLYATIAAGTAALWGPLHGGANQQVLEMLEQIQNDGGDVAKFVNKAKDKNDPFRLMGFGHRVYKNFDPRATIIKKACDDVLAKLGVNDPILDIAKQLEAAALQDPYFVERKLYPNVDFYSGIIYRAIGFSTDMFTVLFALGRLPGWMAQWKEMIQEGQPIGRPRQIYTGPTVRPFVNIENR